MPNQYVCVPVGPSNRTRVVLLKGLLNAQLGLPEKIKRDTIEAFYLARFERDHHPKRNSRTFIGFHSKPKGSSTPCKMGPICKGTEQTPQYYVQSAPLSAVASIDASFIHLVGRLYGEDQALIIDVCLKLWISCYTVLDRWPVLCSAGLIKCQLLFVYEKLIILLFTTRYCSCEKWSVEALQ